MQVCFVVGGPGTYASILKSIIAPIAVHLPGSVVHDVPVEGALNVCFFTEAEFTGDVFMSHGIADKNWRNAPNVARFDYVFVSGPAWREKLVAQGFPAARIIIGGYPKLDPLFQGAYKRSPSARKRVLWAPTHTAIPEVSSDPGLTPFLTRFSDEWEVIRAPHPAVEDGRDVTMQALLDADVVIADSGSLLYEAWALGKPVVFPDWLVAEGVKHFFRGSFEDVIYREGLGYHVPPFADVPLVVEQAYANGIDERTRRFIEGILPSELRGCSGKATAEALRQLR